MITKINSLITPQMDPHKEAIEGPTYDWRDSEVIRKERAERVAQELRQRGGIAVVAAQYSEPPVSLESVETPVKIGKHVDPNTPVDAIRPTTR